jgi:hypothetical protein
MFAWRGRDGELRRGYQVAARLGAWTWDGGGSVTAPSPTIDAYWLGEDGPLSLHLEVGRQTWIWRDVRLVQREPLVVAVTGEPERRKGE